MSVLDTRVARDRTDGVDLAGTVWPFYKLEALVTGLLALLVLLVVTGTTQTAVLGAAAATTIVWWARRIHYRRTRA